MKLLLTGNGKNSIHNFFIFLRDFSQENYTNVLKYFSIFYYFFGNSTPIISDNSVLLSSYEENGCFLRCDDVRVVMRLRWEMSIGVEDVGNENISSSRFSIFFVFPLLLLLTHIFISGLSNLFPNIIITQFSVFFFLFFCFIIFILFGYIFLPHPLTICGPTTNIL